MLDMSPEALAIVQRSFTMAVRADAWLDGELLAADIPIATGSEERDRALAVPERVTLSLPRRDRGISWDPSTDPGHPLAAYGQQLRISYGVDIGRGDMEWIDRGWFLITSSSVDGDTVTITAQGLLELINEARFVAPFQPSGTFTSTVRSLVEPALTVVFDGTLVDRSIPVGMQWDEDRMGALTEVLDAWPAVADVTVDGLLLVEPLTEGGEPVLSLTDGKGGTVIRWAGETTREGAFNVVVAEGEDADGNQIQGVAYDVGGASPFRIGGPFSPLPIPTRFASPLLKTVDQCREAAATRLATLRRRAFRKVTASIVPHPGLMTGDVVSVTGAGLTDAPCVIESLSLPYTPDAMSLTLRVLADG